MCDGWNLTRYASCRISGKPVHVGRVSSSSTQPGQNGGFSDGFLTKSPVDACHSGQPGKSSDPKNPMKSIDYPPCKGSPAHPPSFRSTYASDSTSSDSDESVNAATGIPARIPAHLTRQPRPMNRKRKRTSVVETGTGPARVKIYTVHRKDG